jgi:hypothetical protein
MTLQVGGDVLRHERTADPARLERTLLLVERADDHPFVVVEHRAVERAGNVVERELGRRPRVDDLVEGADLVDGNGAVRHDAPFPRHGTSPSACAGAAGSPSFS